MWSVAKALQVPLDTDVSEIRDIPYTISYVIRKRIQIDNMNELPSEKRPPDSVLWHSNPDKLDDWLDKVTKSGKGKKAAQDSFSLPIGEVE